MEKEKEKQGYCNKKGFLKYINIWKLRGISLIGKADVFGALRWVFESLVPLYGILRLILPILPKASLDYTFLASYHFGIN
jgi:hypothetical protein